MQKIEFLMQMISEHYAKVNMVITIFKARHYVEVVKQLMKIV